MDDDAYKENKNVTLSQAEVNALKKAILYLKFECEETGSLLYAGSPLINSVLVKIIEVDDLGKFSKNFYSKRNVTNEKIIQGKKIKHALENGKEYDPLHDDSFQDYIFPFPAP
ncbi:hypothetical protein [Pantoea sp. CCBC3-3-1]|uniref:hypothetical protein n=1 Tax=Pantoea sp. CCBC3-3-1 TaxID=2490851 RepID=UPI0011BFC4B2|nr:hypothetical protein [Pantoea sp. CCBC3-3-1]